MKKFIATLFLLAASTAGAQHVSQFPLTSGGSVPGNLVFTPSVEWPTLDSRANYFRDGSGNEIGYGSTTEYSGYFDPDKCYRYNYHATDTTRRFFYPVAFTSTRTCSAGNREWSGNFLNWAATQTIDPFRKALTGGYRVIDTSTETVLEKARSDGNTSDGIFGDRRIPLSGSNNALVLATVGANWNSFNTRLRQLNNRMLFTSTGDLGTTTPTHYDPGTHSLGNAAADQNRVYEVYVRVRVCDTAFLEANCVRYPNGNYKPEGLIQKYAGRMRYSVFGYLNDHRTDRDGAAMRARMKYVGPTKIDPATGLFVANTTDMATGVSPEWNANTGVLVQNPDTIDAAATTTAVGGALTISNSGVINYINKFGQMTTKSHKSLDPVSEMYYAALRYLRGLPNIPEYTNLAVGAANANERYELADGFPVISNWTEPFLFHCQRTAILGIGDVNTWNDKNLVGGNRAFGSEPAAPAFGADTVNVDTWTQRVATMEGITIPTEFTGRSNSAYMVGLAYWAHTQDIRPEVAWPNMQTVSTYWVDVREAQVLQPRDRNQYWLAAKYGGFTVPPGFDSTTNTAALDLASWYTNNEDLDPGAGVYRRADNFYVASDAEKMVDSLTRAFARITSDRVGAGAGLAANASRIGTNTRVFQTLYLGNTYGQLQSLPISSTGVVSATPEWTLAVPLGNDATSPGKALRRDQWSFRNIQFNAGGTMRPFIYANLTPTQQTLLTFAGIPTAPAARATNAQHIVDYIRGSDAREEDQTNGTLRTRIAPATGWSPIMGDVINSTPIYVGQSIAGLYPTTATFSGGSTYAAHVTATASRLPVVYLGANDGMLHSFDAATGREIFAFIPHASFLRGLGEFANPDYEHRYFVDGEMAIADAYNGSSWRTILVGTMGRGGPGVFALDITNPLSPTFLWEKGTADIPSLGRNIGRPVIAQTANGVWKVFLGNGLDGDGSARLISINLFGTGTVTTHNTAATTNNGLSAPVIADLDGDGFAETAYAGDLNGNLWKFTGINGTATASNLFIAQIGATRQPITAAPIVARDPTTATVWVYFGTGKFLNAGDQTTNAVQSWYGIKDNGTATSRTNLVARAVTATGTISDGNADTADLAVRVVSEGTVDQMTSAQGWYMDLPVSRERIVLPNQYVAGALIGITRIPDASDVCRPTGSGYLMAINPFTGARLPNSFFDTNRDGSFNENDLLGGAVASGIGMSESPGAQAFLGAADGSNLNRVLGNAACNNNVTGCVTNEGWQGPATNAGRMSWREIIN
jgi:type IV pilus assembly protein PilY1